MVQREVAQIVGLAAKGTDGDLLNGYIMVVDDAIAVAKPCHGVESLGILKLLLSNLEREYAVKSEGEEAAIIRMLHYGIPTLIEELDKKGSTIISVLPSAP